MKLLNKYTFILLFYCTMLSFLSCKQAEDLADGFYFAKSKKAFYDNVEWLRKFNKNNFEKLNEINSQKLLEINNLVADEFYHSETNLGTCVINGCLVQIKNKQIVKTIYFTCDNVQLLIFEKEQFKSSILLNDAGINKIDKILE